MMPLEENLPSGSSHFERRLHCGGFSFKGKISPIRMVLEALSVSHDLLHLFASTFIFQLPGYCSRCPVALVWRIDVLSFLWTNLHLYAFPPFSLLPRILDKIAQDGAELLLVAPWPQRPWFPRLLHLLVGLPRVLPVLKDLVVQPLSQIPHSRVESLHLSLWPLSGSRMRRQAFLKELRSSQL